MLIIQQYNRDIIFSFIVIDEDCLRWMVHFIHQRGMLLVWPALILLTQLPGRNIKGSKRRVSVD